MTRILMAAGVMGLSALTVRVATAQNIQISRENKTIAIKATDEATAMADTAVVSIGFVVYGPDSASTYADGGKASQAVLAALHKAGVEDKNIESAGQGLERNTYFDEKDNAEQRAKKQFVFRQSWQVTVPPQSAATVIRDAVAAGANQSGAIDWRVADRKGLQAKAAEAALVKARSIANEMAEGLRVKLGDLIYASNEAPEVQPMFKAAMAAPSRMAPSEPLPVLEIRPQLIHESAMVYAVFAIE
jgi:uncharacterized protein